MTDFLLSNPGPYSDLFRSLQLNSFSEACEYVAGLPYGRNADRSDCSLVIQEMRGTCSSKHALLAQIALEQKQGNIELICGIFLMSPETHPVLKPIFDHYELPHIPEAHCYLRIEGNRYDFTTEAVDLSLWSSKVVREQRIDPEQVADWKPMIHKHFMGGWLKRNPEIAYSEEKLWEIREEMIALL